jgi:hypothetical protein
MCELQARRLRLLGTVDHRRGRCRADRWRVLALTLAGHLLGQGSTANKPQRAVAALAMAAQRVEAAHRAPWTTTASPVWLICAGSALS